MNAPAPRAIVETAITDVPTAPMDEASSSSWRSDTIVLVVVVTIVVVELDELELPEEVWDELELLDELDELELLDEPELLEPPELELVDSSPIPYV